MDALRELYKKLGMINVQSYIQSGNVVFQYIKSDTIKLKSRISESIREAFGFDVPVLVLELNELSRIIKSNPFIKESKTDTSFLHVTFLSETPQKDSVKKLTEIELMNDKIHHKEKAIYLYCPDKYSNSKLTNGFIESKLKVSATTRNWKTVNELLRIAENTES